LTNFKKYVNLISITVIITVLTKERTKYYKIKRKGDY